MEQSVRRERGSEETEQHKRPSLRHGVSEGGVFGGVQSAGSSREVLKKDWV